MHCCPQAVVIHDVECFLEFTVKPNMSKADSKSSAGSFSLLKWFSIVSAAAIIFLAAGSALFLSQFLSRVMLKHDAQLMMQFVNGVVRADNAHSFFLADGPQGGDLEVFLNQLAALPDMLRANVYSSDSEIIWSSDAGLIGKSFPDNEELKETFEGQPVVNLGTSGGEEKREHVFFENNGIRFVENYLPIWAREGPDSSVIGVIEVYRAPQRLFDALAASTQRVWASAAIVAIVLYGALFAIVRRAARIMDRQHQQLIEAESLTVMGEMASAVAHGLRNPLASIRSSAELAVESDPVGEVKELLLDIITQSDRLGSWVRQYLTYARSSQMAPDKADVSKTLALCLNDLQVQLDRRKIKPHLDMGADLPACNLNSLVLSQIVNSLMANAVEAMANGGDLNVSASFDRGQNTIRVTIEDTGVGMSAHGIEQAFKPFETSKGAGLGLGLPLTRQVLRRHDGDLRIDSVPGHGTRVTMTLRAVE